VTRRSQFSTHKTSHQNAAPGHNQIQLYVTSVPQEVLTEDTERLSGLCVKPFLLQRTRRNIFVAGEVIQGW
jgi:hypothetical protein